MKGWTRVARSSLARLVREQGSDDSEGRAPRVSVVIPTYNRAAMVRRAIESVLGQTFGDLELIVVDDTSSDDTQAVVREIGDERLRYARLDRNRGQWYAENLGIAMARGEWVAFLDDDDEWLPEKLEKQLARLDALAGDGRYAACYCGAIGYNADGSRGRGGRPTPEGDITQYLLRAIVAMGPTIYIVRRDALLAAGGFDEGMAGAQDWDLWLRLSMAGHYFAAAPERLVIVHREHDERQTNNPIRAVRSTFALRRRWGRHMRKAMGPKDYATWLERRDKRSRKAIRKLVRGIERSGSRSDAWRYIQRMTPVWPWGAGSHARMVAVLAFGRLPYRLSRVRRGKAGAPWVRRLFGAR